LKIREELLVYKVAQVIASHGRVMVYLAVFALGRGPFSPSVGLVENVTVFLAAQGSLSGLVLL